MYITIDLVRAELQDRTAEDNTIDCDQFFSDEDIMHAMRRTAAISNSLPPLGVFPVKAEQLPVEVYGYLDGVLANLYNSAIHKLSRNVATWTTGGVSVDLDKTRLDLFSKLKQQLDQSFRENITLYKAEINRNSVWNAF